jgi:hypothetical protein
MKLLALLLLVVLTENIFAQSGDPRVRFRALSEEQIIPTFIEYQAPSPFFRAHSVDGKPPIPEFYHPQNGGERSLAEIKFHLSPVGMWIGEGKNVHSKPLTWEDLKAKGAEVNTPQRIERKLLSEEKIEGKKVLILDYEALLDSSAPWPRFYVSRIWIPIDEDVVVEGMIVCSTPELRATLRSALSAMHIHKYYVLK